MISIEGAVRAVIYILVAGAIYGLLLMLINAVPIPEPFKGWARIVLLVIAILVAIFFLLSFLPGTGPVFRP